MFLVLQSVALAAALIGISVVETGTQGKSDFAERFLTDPIPDSPLEWGVTLFALAACIPAALLAVNIAGRRRMGSLLSVAGRFRWPLFVRALAIGLTGMLILNLVVGTAFGDNTVSVDRRSVALIVVAVILIPFQATAEELLFRGVFMQAIGSWLRHPVFAIIIPTPIFVALHFYDYLGLVDVAVFSLCAGFLAWATGGLEAPIGFHISNNFVAFGLSALDGSNPGDTAVSPLMLAFSVCTTFAITAVMATDKRLTIQNTGTAKSLPIAPANPQFPSGPQMPPGGGPQYPPGGGPLPPQPNWGPPS